MIFIRDVHRMIYDLDTGLGNRWECWQAALILCKYCGIKPDFFCLPSEFPELEHLDIPYLTCSYDKLPTPSNFLTITDEEIDNLIETGKINILKTPNYELDCSWDSIMKLVHFEDWIKDLYFGREIKKYLMDITKQIKIKNTVLDNTLTAFSSNKVGIHIRRGHGIRMLQKDLDLIPKEYQKYYPKPCPECDNWYDFKPDSTYFSIMDSILEENKNVKFYLSIDIKPEAIEYYRKKYKEKIFTSLDFYKTFNLTDTGIYKPIGNLRSIGFNLIDLFILVKCQYFVADDTSSWSRLVIKHRGKKDSYVKDHPKHIKNEYYGF